MTQEQLERYEAYLRLHSDKMNTRIFGSYLRYLDSYLHNKEVIIDGQSWEERMKGEPMPVNIYLRG